MSKIGTEDEGMPQSELVQGNIYTVTEDNRFLIFQFKSLRPSDPERVNSYCWITNMNGGKLEFQATEYTPWVKNRNMRPATWNEELWLRACVRSRELVAQNSILYDNYDVWM
jgi:hypothetical protein